MKTQAEIEHEAHQAARNNADVNDCCPYPFDTAEGQIYRSAFLDERDWLTRNIRTTTPGAQA